MPASLDFATKCHQKTVRQPIDGLTSLAPPRSIQLLDESRFTMPDLCIAWIRVDTLVGVKRINWSRLLSCFVFSPDARDGDAAAGGDLQAGQGAPAGCALLWTGRISAGKDHCMPTTLGLTHCITLNLLCHAASLETSTQHTNTSPWTTAQLSQGVHVSLPVAHNTTLLHDLMLV